MIKTMSSKIFRILMNWYEDKTKRKFFKTFLFSTTVGGNADLYLHQNSIKLLTWQIKVWGDNWKLKLGSGQVWQIIPKSWIRQENNPKAAQIWVKMCTLTSRAWAAWEQNDRTEQKEMGGNVLIEWRQWFIYK